MPAEYFTGFDVGSEFVHTATIDRDNKIVSTPKSRMHFGNPGKCVESLLEGNRDGKTAFVFTGSGGEVFADITGVPFYYDTQTIPLGANLICPEARYVLHLGARDPYFFEISNIGGNGRVYVPDNSTGTKCGGGSGILLTKQCRRLFEDEVSKGLSLQERMEAMYKLAYETAVRSDKEIDVGGRCGVVIQSDMIHLQNEGESIENILRGLFERVAQNYKVDVIRVRKLDPSRLAIATGGVNNNDYIVEMLEKHTGLKLKRPEHFEKVGAIGAALRLKESGLEGQIKTRDLEQAVGIERGNISYAPPLSDYLHLVAVEDEKPCGKFKDLRVFLNDNRDPIPVVMGVDGGSTTTKAFILEEKTSQPIAEICIETHGRPLQAAQNIFGQIRDYFGERLDFRAVAYTGSSGAFYYKLFTEGESADLAIDEITCHALGVRHFDERVDTIFELGGQDAKFTGFGGGTVRKAKMNLSCMAGTGQTMQNMINMIGLSFDEFQEHALRAKRTPIVDSFCGVFTEAGISKLVSLGFPKDEIAAAIAYGFVGGYVNKFVGNENFGEQISAQGGPFKNRACLAALASHIKIPVNAFPHRQLFGAYGAALAAQESLDRFQEGKND